MAGRRDAVGLELRLGRVGLSQSVVQAGEYTVRSSTRSYPSASQRGHDLLLDHLHRGTAGVGRRHLHRHRSVGSSARTSERSRARRCPAPAPRDPGCRAAPRAGLLGAGVARLTISPPGASARGSASRPAGGPRCSVCRPWRPPRVHVRRSGGSVSVARRTTSLTTSTPRGLERRRLRRAPRPRAAGPPRPPRTARRCRARARPAPSGPADDSRRCRRPARAPTRRCGGRDSGLPCRPWPRCRRARCAAARWRASSEQHAPGVEEELAYDGDAEVAVGQLDQVDVAVVDRRRGSRPARPRRAPCPRPRRRAGGSSVACPMRSSATLASAMSSSRIGPCPHHSDSRWPSTSRSSPSRSRYSKSVLRRRRPTRRAPAGCRHMTLTPRGIL